MRKNRCKGLWNLTVSPINYIHSSQFYETGIPGIYAVTNYKELEKINSLKDNHRVLANAPNSGASMQG